MVAAEEKIRVIEQILETDDVALLHTIDSLLHRPALADYPLEPMSEATFMAKIDQAEEAALRGEVTSQEEVRQLIASWGRK
jgi:predicted transcriptional regulator